MKNNNKGLSLVELIVSIGMFAIVGAMIVSFVAISSKTYTNVSAEIDVQQEAQLTLNQIKDLVIDTNRAVAYGIEAPDLSDPNNDIFFTKIDETNTEVSIVSSLTAGGVDEALIKRVLVIYSEKSTTTTEADGTIVISYTYPIVKIIYDSDKNQLYYAQHVFVDVADIDISSFGIDENGIYLLSEYVTGFNVDLSDIEDSQVDMQVDFSSSSQAGVGREYLATPTINLRNKVIVSENLSDIYINSGVQINSFVVGIDILKDGTIIHGDSIQLGSNITYTANVEVQYGASDAYTWKLTGDNIGFKSTVNGIGEVVVPLDEPSGTLTLTAIAVGDTSKTESIPITVSGELRPTNISISTSETAIMGTADDVRKIYTFSAITTYMDGSTTNGQNISWTPPSDLPSGAYTAVNASGQMLLYLMANGGLQDYTVFVRADELNVAGEVVSTSKTVTPGDLTYVDPSIMNVEIIPFNDTISRGDGRTLTANVSDFTGNEENLHYTWEILEAESVGFSGSDINSIGNVQLISEAGSAEDEKQLVIGKDLNWSSEFEVKVKVTASDDVAGEVQSDSYIASFIIEPVAIVFDSVNIIKRTWDYREKFDFELENVILTINEMNNMTRFFTYSGEGVHYRWGYSMTFEDSEISRYKEATKIDYNTSRAGADRYVYSSGGYINTLHYQFTVVYEHEDEDAGVLYINQVTGERTIE